MRGCDVTDDASCAKAPPRKYYDVPMWADAKDGICNARPRVNIDQLIEKTFRDSASLANTGACIIKDQDCV